MSTNEKIRSAAGDAAEKTKSVAKEAAETVKEQAHAQAVGAKDSVAGEVKSVASALRTASSELREGSPQERALGQVAETLADVSDSIRQQDLGEMVSGASNFARRNPLVFLGSAAFLGFAAARFAKSSSDDGSTGRQTNASASGGEPHPHTTAAYPTQAYDGDRT